MVPVEGASPVLIGNKVESIVPYHMSDEFVVNAKEDGQVVEKTPDYVVVKYKSGKNYAIDIGHRVRKNSSGGFFIENDLQCDLEVGKKFKKGDILAFNPVSFGRNSDGKGVSMKLGVLTKVAVLSNWDMFEDSAPITDKLANQLATTMIAEKSVTLDPWTVVDKMVKIGDKVNTGDPLIRFSKAIDEETAAFIKTIREDRREEIIEDTKTTLASKYTGEIADIRIYTTVPISEMDPSLQKIVKDYHKRIKRKTDVLEKYKNEGDCNFYKAGQVISETPDIVKPGATGKVLGEYVDAGIIIKIYTAYRDIAAKGDKVCAEFALKGVCSHVIKKGWEPYSEYRPDEEISTMIAPLAIAARKTPSVFIAMFGNKCLIEMKRQLKDLYDKKTGSIATYRAKFMDKLVTTMDLLDPTGQNGINYVNTFKGMSDTQFNSWCSKFFADELQNFYLEIVEYERDLTIENVEKCAKYLQIPLMEKVALPYATEDPDNILVTPTPVPVGYIHEKRMPQTLMKKSAGSISREKRSAKTGTVKGDDKNARNTDTETYSMIAVGAEMGLREFMGPRADDMKAKTQMYSSINRKGYVSLSDLESGPEDKVALNTFDAYFAMQGLLTNLVSPLHTIGVARKK